MPRIRTTLASIAESGILCKIQASNNHRDEGMNDVALHAVGENSSLVAQAFNRLRFAILRTESEPGAKLRLEALQERYGFSSSPLREALNRLAAEGLVEVEDWRGFRVKPASLGELDDITRLRVLLEQEALRLAMIHGRDDWEAAILAAFHRVQLAQGRLSGAELVLDDDWSARHREFHHALIAACGSPNLIQLCGTYFVQAERYRHLSARFRKLTKNVGAMHQRLMEAVLARQTPLALELIADHIEGTSKRVAKVLAQSPFAVDATAARESRRTRKSR
jgi:GntR family transcriptional regulator, carbon starvation induced regulator